MIKTHLVIKDAVQRGYKVTECGTVYGLFGKLELKLYGSQRYPTVSIKTNLTDSGVFGLPAHHLAAYCFYGDESFRTDLVIRHLDGNTLNLAKTNIILGTHSENNLDKPKEVRVAAAKAARASQGRTPLNAKLSEKTREEIYKFRRIGYSYTQLASQFGVSRSTICNLLTGATYNDS